MVQYKSSSGEGVYSWDQWPGYAPERIRADRFVAERRVRNPVVLTCISSDGVNDLRVDVARPFVPVATEFVAIIATGATDYDNANEDRCSPISVSKFPTASRLRTLQLFAPATGLIPDRRAGHHARATVTKAYPSSKTASQRDQA